MKLKPDHEKPKSQKNKPLNGKWEIVKTEHEMKKSQVDKMNLKQWKKEKALKDTKEIGKHLVIGMANGLSMYGQIVPCLYFGGQPPISPNLFNNTKKW